MGLANLLSRMNEYKRFVRIQELLYNGNNNGCKGACAE